MSDKRFFKADGPFALGQIAELVGGRLASPDDMNIIVEDVACLKTARDGDIAVFCDTGFADAFATSHASVVVTSEKLARLPHNGSAILVVDDPKTAFARIGQMFYPRKTSSGKIHPSAVVPPCVKLGEDVEIAAGAVIGDGVAIGARSRIGANAVIGDGVVIGADCSIGPNTSISHTLIGQDRKSTRLNSSHW